MEKIDAFDSAIESQGNTGAFVGEYKRGKHTPLNKISNENIARVKQHMQRFPKVESHNSSIARPVESLGAVMSRHCYYG